MVDVLQAPASNLGRDIAVVCLEPADCEAVAAAVEALSVSVYERVDDPAVLEDPASPSRDWPGLAIVVGRSGEGRLRRAIAALSSRGRVVIALCGQPGPGDVRALLRVGAAGVVARDDMSHALVPTVIAAASGQVCIPGRHSGATIRPPLSIREKQVVGLVAMGLTNGEIAGRLFLAESTVKSHLSSAFAKLGVRSRHEAVELILDPASGMGLGFLSLDAEPVEPILSKQARG